MQDKDFALLHQGGETHLLKEIMQTHQALVNVFSREVGMPAARLSLMRLLAVCRHEKLGTMQISRRLGIDAAAVTRQVKEMATAGLIERLADPGDGRRSIVRLTPLGLRVFQQIHARAHEFEKSLSTIVTQEDIATTVRVLSQLQKALLQMR
jgi:DNA-binding MarR family transcriptional regulator